MSEKKSNKLLGSIGIIAVFALFFVLLEHNVFAAAVVLILGGTLVIKKFFNSKTWIIASMMKTNRYNHWFKDIVDSGNLILKKITGKENLFDRVLDFIADSGLVLGFGIFGLDYLIRKKYSYTKRAIIAILGFLFLFYFYNYTLGVQASSNAFISITELSSFIMNITFGIAGFLGFTLYAMALASIDILTKVMANEPACPGVAPVIPGVEIPRVPISIPWFGWISFLLIIVIHEGFHALQLARQKNKVKGTGILLLGLIPIGAFVEPDEEELKNEEDKRKLRVFSAGPSSNLYSLPVIGLIFFAFITLSTPYFLELNEQADDLLLGLRINSVDESIDFCNYSAPNQNHGKLNSGDIILAVNNEPVKNLRDFFERINDKNNETGMMLTLQAEDGSVRQEQIGRDEKTNKIGITLEDYYDPNNPKTENFLFQRGLLTNISLFIGWTLILSLLVGMFNFLPIAITDGAHMAPIIFAPYFEKIGLNKKKAAKIVSIVFLLVFLVLILLNALPYFFSV